MKKLAFISGMAFFCSFSTLFTSCSKDLDLLAESVVVDNSYSIYNSQLLVNDMYFISSNEPIVLDVLSNDSLIEENEISIIKTSEPKNGTVVINNDKTLTYIPITNITPTEIIQDNTSSTTNSDEQEPFVVITENTTSNPTSDTVTVESSDSASENSPKKVEEETSTDNFSYTVETIDDEGNKKTEEAIVEIVYDYGELKAFPGAEGFGKNASGGRGGYVIHVTNLNDSGAGSLRDAVEGKTGTRTVVFDVSGNIHLENSLKIRDGHGNITIAGQTAPKGGITLKGASVWIQDSNVIMRYLRIRTGKDWHPNGQNPSDENYEPDDAFRIIAFSGSNIENIILDHCTISWGRDGLLDITTVGNNSSIKNVTISNTILSENVDKGYATLISGNVDNVTYYQNYIAHCSTRNIAMNALDGDVEFINNIIYGLSRGAWIKYSCRANLIGNSYITNPNSYRPSETLRLEINNGADPTFTKVYLEDNLDDNHSITYNSRMEDYLYDSQNQSSGIIASPSSSLKQLILDKVGNSIYRDAADERVINNLNTLSGKFIKHENEVGGYPTIESKKHPSNHDSDQDGMPDVWENNNDNISSQTSDGNIDFNNDGFTNLEDYLHFLTLN